LVLSDTTEYNLHRHRGRIKDFDGIGSTSLNDIYGFFSQNQLVVERQTNQTLGWAHVYLFNRSMNNKPFVRSNCSVPIAEKESNKWLEPSLLSRDKILKSSEHNLFVMDREADIYEVMSSLPSKKSDFLIRAKHNRRVLNTQGEIAKLKQDLEEKEVRAEVILTVNGESRTRSKRQAKCEIRYETYSIPRPPKIFDKLNYPENISATAIWIKEVSLVPQGEKPIEWLLWTSEKVINKASAIELLSCYSARWTIEEAHRLLKTKGFNIEATELESGKSIRKLLILGMEASIKVMQLKAAREGESLVKTDEVFNKEEILFLEVLNNKLQGSTEKLKNPHVKEKLAWASWVIARLGGWKGYKSQRPPGTITFKRGLDSYYQQHEGFLAALEFKDMCKR